jgi:hypothetical protein
MSAALIIAGRFPTKGEADAVAAVIGQYVDATDICIFHNNPQGQHDAPPARADQVEDPGAQDAGSSAAGTAIAAGLTAGAIGALGGPVVAIAAAATGAYVGSLAGAMGGLGEHAGKPHALERRPGGIMLSVRIARPADEKRVIASLRAGSAADIERARGDWRNGDWTDFNPVEKPQLVSGRA